MVLKYQYPFPISAYDTSDPYGGYGTPPSRSSPHRGCDWNRGVGAGSPIAAIASGTAVRNEWNDALGNVLVIAHPDGAYSGYCHMSASSPIPKGTAVTRGQIIGTIGNTGSASFGAHLHLTMGSNENGALGGGAYNADHFDPIAYIQARLNGDDPSSTPPAPPAPPKPKIGEETMHYRALNTSTNGKIITGWIYVQNADGPLRAVDNLEGMAILAAAPFIAGWNGDDIWSLATRVGFREYAPILPGLKMTTGAPIVGPGKLTGKIIYGTEVGYPKVTTA